MMSLPTDCDQRDECVFFTEIVFNLITLQFFLLVLLLFFLLVLLLFFLLQATGLDG